MDCKSLKTLKTQKKIKRTYTLATMIVSMTGDFKLNQAEDNHSQIYIPHFDDIKRVIIKLFERLLLSDEQENKVSASCFILFEKIKQRIRTGRSNSAEMNVIRNDFEKDMMSILDQEQKKIFMAFKQTHLPKPYFKKTSK